MTIKTREQRLEEVLRDILREADADGGRVGAMRDAEDALKPEDPSPWSDTGRVIERAEDEGKVGDFAALVALCLDPETDTGFYAVSEGDSVFLFCEEDIRAIAGRVAAEESDGAIDRWIAADMANGGDPTTYWSRKAAAISSGEDVENVPSIIETIVTLRRRAERAEEAYPRSLAGFFDVKAEWSAKTFGPGGKYDHERIVAHIRKELKEIEAKPDDLEEWVDVVLLGMDGAWRSAGANGMTFAKALFAKHVKNMERRWPDWRTLAPGQVAEHVRENDVPTLPAPPEKE